VVKYGSQLGILGNQGQGAWGTKHNVTIGNLTPNTQYFFQVASGQTLATAVKGPVEGFKTLQAGAHAQNNPACCTVFSH
jgi:phosphodiesterase/alkaline phosphatase D-like protein